MAKASKFVQSNVRKRVARPEPAQQHRSTNRNRTRAQQRARAIRDAS